MTPHQRVSEVRTPRADARRNIAAILDAATSCLARDPEVSIAEIASAAGVGRITLYGHFKNRAELVEAVLLRSVDEADDVLRQVDLTGDDPIETLEHLVHSSWEIVDRFRGVLRAARRELPGERILAAHDRVMAHLAVVVEHGRSGGAFRTDLPAAWLVTMSVGLMHAAAEEVDAGRLDRGAAADQVAASLIAAYTAPGSMVPASPAAAAQMHP